MSIRIDVLGAPRCFVDDRELADLPAQKTRFALLIYLAVERNVSRDEVAAIFWPDSDDDRARHALSQSLYELKRAVGDDWLETSSGRLLVKTRLSVDADAFTKYLQEGRNADALSLYRGPFLGGFSLPSSAAFEQWLDRQRASYERLHRKIRRELVESLLAADRLADATDAARRWVDIDPLEDEANHRLIELLAITGSRTEALNLYAAYEQRLKEELDVQPLDDTKELVRRLRAPDAQFSVSAPLTAVAATPRAQAVLPGPKGQFFGRKYWRQVGIGIGAIITVLAFIVDVWSIVTTGNIRISPRWLPIQNDPVASDATIAVLPFEYDSNVSVRLNEENLLHEALSVWQGITIVDLFQVRDALTKVEEPLRPADALAVARALGAGRYLRGRVSLFMDSLLVHTVMYETNRGGRRIYDRMVRIPLSLAGVDSVFADVAVKLLFGDEPSRAKASDFPIVTRSVPARRAFAAAQNAITEWDLAAADSNFVAAVRYDHDYAVAHLWLAQVRVWQNKTIDEWKSSITRAAGSREQLSPRDETILRALSARANRDFGEACRLYESLTRDRPRDFAAWYGLADCLNRDKAVVQDPRSPTGFAFRSSFRQATLAYERAFVLMPSVYRAFRGSGFEKVRGLFVTNAHQLRGGVAANDETEFVAYASWNADTLAFFPRPRAEITGAAGWARAHGRDRAIREQRKIFLGVARSWAAAFPNDADAKHALAIALELVGDPNSLDTLRAARTLSASPADRLRLAASQVWLQIKFSAPYDLVGLRQAAALADSVLADPASESAVDISVLSSLAAVRGKAVRTVRLYRHSQVTSLSGLSPPRGGDAHALLAFAAFGGPRDSLAILEERLSSLVGHSLGDEEEWSSWAQRIQSLAYGKHAVELPALTLDNELVIAQNEANRGNRAAVDKWLVDLTKRRQGIPANELTIDVLLPESRVIASVYGAGAAARWLDRPLLSLRWTSPRALADVPRAVSLVEAFAFRADLAARMGDMSTARKWAACASILWSGADDFLRPTTSRMTALVKRP